MANLVQSNGGGEKLHTDSLHLYNNQPSGFPKKAKYGEDVIVGVVDTAIWPESRSFDDDGYGPVLRRWRRVCQAGEVFNATCCNRKLIGARWYSGAAPGGNGEDASPRDGVGHGTHTASTAARRAGAGREPRWRRRPAGSGRWRGAVGVPRARVAVYKACVGGECGDAEVLVAVEDAVHGGVDVLSLSLGGSSGEEIPGTLHAVRGASPSCSPPGTTGPCRRRCSEKALESVNITGKVVLCSAPTEAAASPPAHAVFGTILRVVAGRGRGLIFAQYTTNLLDLLDTCDGYMPCVLVNYEVARRISSYAGGARSPVVRIHSSASVAGDGVLAPRVAAFSSRGPSAQFPAILKPDIAAPGASILAAKGDSYVFMSGTSMACPRVSAVVALLKSVHPDWSPAMIKSAIVTTGKHSL
ncbi:hypothetical protein SETIT_8G162100v2 [Setaria italica]|uniref:Peptidase S8/S53 domain-containing protein n=1 Tax=Setaria italica TaxID=4555 RepID=A0A368S8I0_SETIT|nr:hypothetical protein SETIT_8G162100v2 [Setaria italica]